MQKIICPKEKLIETNEKLHIHCENTKVEFRDKIWKDQYTHLCRLQRLYQAMITRQK